MLPPNGRKVVHVQSGATLLVASAGGHLRQLVSLTATLGGLDSRAWATYDVSHARSELNGSDFVGVHHPSTKNLPNALRNYRLARKVFAEHEVIRVVSTGAGVAVPFMLRARQLGIPCHYIESATRVQGPSLTGRILARVPGVKLYRQLGAWGGSRWRQGPCVFDGYSSGAGEARGIQRVVVSFGSHHFPFPRAVEAISRSLPQADVEVLWQLGSTPDPGTLQGRVVKQLPSEELQAEIEHADVVIGHAGVGLSLTALAAGKVPVLLPRRRPHREHTDDHQTQLAPELVRRGLAIGVEVEELTGDHLADAAARTVSYVEPPPFQLVD